MVLQLWSIGQLVQFLGKYVIILKFMLIYLNDLKFKIQKYYLLLRLIATQFLNDDDVKCHVSMNSYN
jgi:hypothetical protein